MSQPWFRSNHYFHPVGQGLFSSGYIESSGGAPFLWVYDCGTTSSKRLLEDSLDQLKNHRPGRAAVTGQIQLVAISHFDSDHVNGLVSLLGLFTIDILLLPYVPLWKRLVLAADEGIGAGDALFGFFVDPAAFLLSGDGGHRIRRILFVPASDPDEPPAPPEGGGPPDEGEPPDDPDRPREREREPEPIKPEYSEGPAPADAADDPMLSGPQAGKVGFLAPNSALYLRRFWEFVPYNDSAQAPSDAGFEQKASALSAELLEADDADERDELLGRLKTLYARNFGTSGHARNVISLFLYGGPLGRPLSARVTTVQFFRERRYHHYYFNHMKYGWEGPEGPVLSRLFTGDGYLNTCARLRAFTDFFAPFDRLAKTALFQVMHHGAEGNWHPGLAESVRPAMSVFCSDPGHRGYGHPHAAVLRDFWTYNPVQVDKYRGCAVETHFCYT